MTRIILIVLFISSTLKAISCCAQNKDFKNLSEYVTKNKLYDFGYGLEQRQSRIDSIVCFNDFMSNEIIYKDSENLSFDSNDSIFTITTNLRKRKGVCLNIVSGKKTISKLELNDSVKDFKIIANTYRIKFQNKSYSILYLTDEYAHQTFRVQYLGIIVDEKSKLIFSFPRFQSTNSLLNITDLDNDRKLDLVCYNPAFTGKIEVFSLTKNNWKLQEKFICKLKSTDNFVWQIDFDSVNFLKDYYQKAIR